MTNSSSRLSQAHKPEHHGLRRHDHVDPDVEPEKLKTVNNALVTLRFSCVYGSAKRHTICVATHVVFLVGFERPRPAFEYAGTPVVFGSGHERNRIAEIQRQRSSTSDGEDATLQPSAVNRANETDDVLRRYAGANA